MLDARKPATVPIQPNYNYSIESNFTPPVMKVGPVSGIINNIPLESELRNQTYALHKGNDNAVYVPSTGSDLYKVYIPSSPSEQPHPELFHQPTFSQLTHPNIQNNPQVGNDRFHNNTRTQLKTLVHYKSGPSAANHSISGDKAYAKDLTSFAIAPYPASFHTRAVYLHSDVE